MYKEKPKSNSFYQPKERDKKVLEVLSVVTKPASFRV